jgi:glutaredoxin
MAEKVDEKKANKTLWILGVIVVIVIAGLITNGFGLFSGKVVSEPTSNFEDIPGLALHLAQTTTLYHSKTCPHCHTQLAMFGEYQKDLNEVECLANPTICEAKNLRGVPAWEIKSTGEILYGVQSLETLASKTGF